MSKAEKSKTEKINGKLNDKNVDRILCKAEKYKNDQIKLGRPMFLRVTDYVVEKQELHADFYELKRHLKYYEDIAKSLTGERMIYIDVHVRMVNYKSVKFVAGEESDSDCDHCD